jgi:hypothetical protein
VSRVRLLIESGVNPLPVDSIYPGFIPPRSLSNRSPKPPAEPSKPLQEEPATDSAPEGTACRVGRSAPPKFQREAGEEGEEKHKEEDRSEEEEGEQPRWQRSATESAGMGGMVSGAVPLRLPVQARKYNTTIEQPGPKPSPPPAASNDVLNGTTTSQWELPPIPSSSLDPETSVADLSASLWSRSSDTEETSQEKMVEASPGPGDKTNAK